MFEYARFLFEDVIIWDLNPFSPLDGRHFDL